MSTDPYASLGTNYALATEECRCVTPNIKCDNKGCRCTTCGLPEGLKLYKGDGNTPMQKEDYPGSCQ